MTEATTHRQQNVLIVTAHPEPRSLTASLADFAAEELRTAEHRVQVSDLYAMKWKSEVDADDFPGDAADPLNILADSGRATLEGRLSPNIAAEQEKLLWSDAVILQFPLWWFSMPAILKGWVDRVLTFEFAHGPGVPPPYSEGVLPRRRALVSVTSCAREAAFSDRGIHGTLADLLFPLQHGIFWFTGIAPLELFAVYDALDVSEERFAAAKRAYRRRLAGLFTEDPVPFRTLTGGDYDREMRLLPGVEPPGTKGFDLHVRPRG